MLPDGEPCEGCRVWCRENRSENLGALPLMARDYAALLVDFGEAARSVHGGAKGRELARAYEEARDVLRRVWG